MEDGLRGRRRLYRLVLRLPGAGGPGAGGAGGRGGGVHADAAPPHPEPARRRRRLGPVRLRPGHRSGGPQQGLRPAAAPLDGHLPEGAGGGLPHHRAGGAQPVQILCHRGLHSQLLHPEAGAAQGYAGAPGGGGLCRAGGAGGLQRHPEPAAGGRPRGTLSGAAHPPAAGHERHVRRRALPGGGRRHGGLRRRRVPGGRGERAVQGAAAAPGADGPGPGGPGEAPARAALPRAHPGRLGGHEGELPPALRHAQVV